MGEREIIRILTSLYGRRQKPLLGFNDDVAAIPASSKGWIILKSDMLVASTDIPRGMTLRQAGRKAVVATVSDFAAKGVAPLALLTSIGLPRGLSREDVGRIGKGLADGAREYHCNIVGGDTGESNDIVIDCMGVGVGDPGQIMRRSGARPGDIVAVTGRFGKPAAGLRILLSNRKPSLPGEVSLRRAVVLPKARLKEGLILGNTRSVTSSIDSSDGLAWSLHELARASHVSIHLDTVPVAPEAADFATQTRIKAVELALYGGEEYELVLTIRPNVFGKAKRRIPSLMPIGHAGKGPPRVTANVNGRIVEVQARGWEHLI